MKQASCLYLSVAVGMIVLAPVSGFALRGAIPSQEKAVKGEGRGGPGSATATKDGVPTEIISARNVARLKKRFTLVIFHAKKIKKNANTSSGNVNYEIGKLKGSKASSAVDVYKIEQLMASIHMKILKTKIYIRHSQMKKIAPYKYCDHPAGPMFVVISPTGEDIAKFYYYEDTIDFYNRVTGAMFRWCKKQFEAGKIEDAYNGIISLDTVGKVYKDKDALNALKEQIFKAYEKKDGEKTSAPAGAEKPEAGKNDQATAAAGDDASKAGSDSKEAVKPDMKNNPDAACWKKSKAIYSQARALEKYGQKDAAIKTYKRIVKDYPESPWAVKAGDRLDDLAGDAETETE